MPQGHAQHYIYHATAINSNINWKPYYITVEGCRGAYGFPPLLLNANHHQGSPGCDLASMAPHCPSTTAANRKSLSHKNENNRQLLEKAITLEPRVHNITLLIL